MLLTSSFCPSSSPQALWSRESSAWVGEGAVLCLHHPCAPVGECDLPMQVGYPQRYPH